MRGEARLLAVLALLDHVHCQNRCAAFGASELVYEQAVSIKTSVTSNITFNPIPQAAFTVTNAPTSLDTLVTLSWTTTEARTPSTPLPERFVLMSQTQKHQKRQSGNTFVGFNGVMTQDCAQAVQYELVNGQLLANSSDGTLYYFSTSPGLDYAPFVPTTVPGPISTTFNITYNYELAWTNPQFRSGQAQWCSVNGTLYAIFQNNPGPQGCLYAPLNLAYGPGCVLLSNSGQEIAGDR